MTIGNAILEGFRVARRIRSAVWLVLAANLGLAAFAAYPIYRGIRRFTSHSLLAEPLAFGFVPDWLTDFAANNPGSLERYAEVIVLIGVVAIPVNAVLAGGLLGQIKRLDGPFALVDFVSDAARYAWDLLRLMLLGLAIYWLVFRFVYQGLGGLVERGTRDWVDARAVFIAEASHGALLVLVLLFVNLVMDFARIRIVKDDMPSVFWAFLSALGFSVARFHRVAVIYLVPTICGLALLGIYRLAVPWDLLYTPFPGEGWMVYREPAQFALLFVGQQIVMFGRFWFRAATWAGEWSYHDAATAPASEPAAPLPAAPGGDDVRRRERAVLRAICHGTREGPLRELARLRLGEYRWREPVHEVIFQSLLSLPAADPAVVREQLPALLTRRGFPDVEIADLLEPQDLSRDEFERLLDELTS